MVKVGLNTKNEWVVLPKDTKNGLYIDGYLKENLDTAKNVIRKDWDMIFVYDGYEGSGKSVKAMQDAFYCDPSLNIDRIVFNPDDFAKAVSTANKFQAIIFDEAYGGLSSRGAMSQINKSLVQMLTVIREKNLFIFIVLPCFFDLDKYVALWRSRALVHVYSVKGFQRGYFEFYNADRKKTLYIKGKKEYNYGVSQANFSGRFTNNYVVDEEKYRKKKKETSMDNNDKSNTLSVTNAKEIKTAIAKNLYEDPELKLNKVQIAKILGVTRMTIHNYINKKGENA